MCQFKLINCNKCNTLGGRDVDNEVGCAHAGAEYVF